MIEGPFANFQRGLAALAFVASACTSAPEAEAPPPAGVEQPSAERVRVGDYEYDTVPEGLDPKSIPPPSFARLEGYFPNTELLTQDGEKVRFYDDLIKGKIVLINFMYTNCDGI